MDQIYKWRNNPKRSLFYTSFIQYILEFNNIRQDDANLLEAPKVFDSTTIKLRKY